MRRFALLVAVPIVLALAACNEQAAAPPPPPQALTADAMGHYCGMNVLEHPGPKGQIILASRIDPVWFSAARDAVAFTLMPDEPRDIRAVYVSDMARAESWDAPGATNWVEVSKAWFVVDSRLRGGMGAPETVPFGERSAADAFVEKNGGRVVRLAEIPHDYVLGGPAEPVRASDATTAHGH
ncbi:nitrous oxide reductase accessory protein NosL [Rhodoplanes roseus]|uniref:Copper resistance protein CopZ n=1 Tax=Rhodoplanes roseus TaxID=29409 RepID=A0A327KZ10_9BRAD|nr:nitrous oxide reductase accessory protein NosL [Rhodoplanes roseus]RAI43376.1 copper resistance protein CopZ [Rhodoplanes roseus]